MSLEGEKLAARFSCNCWTARVKKFQELLREFARNGANREKSIVVLQKLVSFAWYQIIARQNNVDDLFDAKIVMAYWMGDENLVKPIGSEKNIILPFHNFTVLEDVHRYSDTITIDDVDRCKVSVGRVNDVGENQIKIDHQALIRQGGEFSLAQDTEIISVEMGFVKSVKMGDWVVYHEGIAIDILPEKEALTLVRRTKEAIELFNLQQK